MVLEAKTKIHFKNSWLQDLQCKHEYLDEFLQTPFNEDDDDTEKDKHL